MKVTLVSFSTLEARIGQFLPLRRNHNAKSYDPTGFWSSVMTSFQESDRACPTFVLLIATQKTNATRSTIKVYSTRPCPSSSTTNLFRSSIILSPPFLRPLINSLESQSTYNQLSKAIFCDLPPCWIAERAVIMPGISNYTFQSFPRNKTKFLQDFFDKSDRLFE